MITKLLSLWSEYKYVALAALFVVVAASTWNISNKVAVSEFNAERVRLLQKTIEAQQANDKLKNEITTTLLENLKLSQAAIQKANKEAINEILTDPRYRTCTVTPGVRNAYRNAISAQQSSSGSNGKVPAPQAATVR